MLKSERDFVNNLRWNFGASLWQQPSVEAPSCLDDYIFEPVQPDEMRYRRRYIVLVPDGQQGEALRARWGSMVVALASERDEFKRQVKKLAVDQQLDADGKAERTTRLPILVGDGRPVEKITTTISEAFRSGALNSSEILRYLKQRKNKYATHIENAANARKRAQEAAYSVRLSQLENEILQVNEIIESGKPVIGRRPTNFGVHVRFSFADDTPSVLMTTSSIIVAVTTSTDVGVEIATKTGASSRRQYGEPLLQLEEAKLYIYAAPDSF